MPTKKHKVKIVAEYPCDCGSPPIYEGDADGKYDWEAIKEYTTKIVAAATKGFLCPRCQKQAVSIRMFIDGRLVQKAEPSFFYQ
jgi:hypothetical protein